jgi:hypothetical protein
VGNTVSARGNSPITFVFNGKQIVVPLTAMSFVDGVLQPKDGDALQKAHGLNPKDEAFVAWMRRLTVAKLVTPGAPTRGGTSPAPTPSGGPGGPPAPAAPKAAGAPTAAPAPSSGSTTAATPGGASAGAPEGPSKAPAAPAPGGAKSG